MKKVMTTAEFDRLFDEGKDFDDAIDWSKPYYPDFEKKRVYLNLPISVVNKLDQHAKQQGIPRKLLINKWLSQKLESVS